MINHKRIQLTKLALALSIALSATSTAHAPWHIIPADHKWFTRLVVAQVVISELESLRLEYPKVDAERRKELAEARKALEKEKG